MMVTGKYQSLAEEWLIGEQQKSKQRRQVMESSSSRSRKSVWSIAVMMVSLFTWVTLSAETVKAGTAKAETAKAEAVKTEAAKTEVAQPAKPWEVDAARARTQGGA